MPHTRCPMSPSHIHIFIQLHLQFLSHTFLIENNYKAPVITEIAWSLLSRSMNKHILFSSSSRYQGETHPTAEHDAPSRLHTSMDPLATLAKHKGSHLPPRCIHPDRRPPREIHPHHRRQQRHRQRNRPPLRQLGRNRHHPSMPTQPTFSRTPSRSCR